MCDTRSLLFFDNFSNMNDLSSIVTDLSAIVTDMSAIMTDLSVKVRLKHYCYFAMRKV